MEKKKTQNTMKTMFKGYIDYDNEEYNKIWEEALIVVDTNILLNFYRYSEDTRKELNKILNKLKKRLWIPYQVAKEYFNNRDKVMANSYNEYDKLIGKITARINDAKNEIAQKKSKQLKCKDSICDILEQTLKNIETKLKEEMEEKNPKTKKSEIEEIILGLFDNCIGEKFEEKEYEKIKEEGLKRVKQQIPPGYKDSEKEENGDYYIFYAMIEKAKEQNKPVIFITDDVKEDWFNNIEGEKQGGRYELLNEFFNETGNLLLIYTSDGFVQAYNKNISKKPSNEKMLNELKDIRRTGNFYIRREESNYITMLKQHKKALLHVPELVNFEELFQDLFNIISKTLLFSEDRFIYERKLVNLRMNIYELDKGETIDKTISLINELIIRITEKRNKYTLMQSVNKNKEKTINKQFQDLIKSLSECKTFKEKSKIYKLISINTQLYIIHLLENDSENKKAIELAKSLEEILPTTPEELETVDDKAVIEKIEMIILKEEIYR